MSQLTLMLSCLMLVRPLPSLEGLPLHSLSDVVYALRVQKERFENIEEYNRVKDAYIFNAKVIISISPYGHLSSSIFLVDYGEGETKDDLNAPSSSSQ